jgi:hypothetical protein
MVGKTYIGRVSRPTRPEVPEGIAATISCYLPNLNETKSVWREARAESLEGSSDTPSSSIYKVAVSDQRRDSALVMRKMGNQRDTP